MRILLFLLTVVAWAQPPGAPKLVFPDDSQDPKLAGGAELLEAVCPGHVVVGMKIECKMVCPEFTGFKGDEFEWNLSRVTRGHFLSPTSDDAVLAMSGCESHASNFGGTVLLTKHSGKWTMLWYKDGIPTEQCHIAKLKTQREILVCVGTTSAQASWQTDIYAEDLLEPKRALMAADAATFFGVQDTTVTCGENPQDDSRPFPIKRGYIERVQFQNASDGTIQGLSVFGLYGERTLTGEQVETCLGRHPGVDFRPATKPFRVDFKFDGGRMIRVGATPGAPK